MLTCCERHRVEKRLHLWLGAEVQVRRVATKRHVDQILSYIRRKSQSWILSFSQRLISVFSSGCGICPSLYCHRVWSVLSHPPYGINLAGDALELFDNNRLYKPTFLVLVLAICIQFDCKIVKYETLFSLQLLK